MDDWWWHGMWQGMAMMWIFPAIFLIVGIVLVVLLLRGAGWTARSWHGDGARETPREILDRRYASGEITREQYEEMKRVLEGTRT